MATGQAGQWGRQGAPHSTKTILGKLIKVRNLRVYEVAAQVGVDPRTMSYYINGRKPVPGDIALKLSRVLGVDHRLILKDQPTYADKGT